MVESFYCSQVEEYKWLCDVYLDSHVMGLRTVMCWGYGQSHDVYVDSRVMGLWIVVLWGYGQSRTVVWRSMCSAVKDIFMLASVPQTSKF